MKFFIHIVDDQPLIAQTLAAILEAEGYEVLSFTRPLKSLQSAAIIAPNLLLSDVAMPGISGFELALLMSELCPNCKIILFSGHASAADLSCESAAKGHAFEVLRKPIHPLALLAAVKSVSGDVLEGGVK